MWAREGLDLSDLSGDLAGTHWAAIRDLLSAYQRITSVLVGNEAATSFWHDIWLLDEPLAVKLPTLFSHFTGQASSMRNIVHRGLHNLLQLRLTNQAAQELQLLDTLLLEVALDGSSNQWSSLFQDGDLRLLTRFIYKASAQGDQPCPAFKFVWHSFVQPRVKFFAWLLTKNRIHCRANLVHKNILLEL